MSALKYILVAVIVVGTTIDVLGQNSKPVVGVGEITSSVGGDPESFRTMLETAIAQTNKFELVERSRIDDILGEQGLSAAGLAEGTGQISGVGGVDYLIYGSITKLGQEKSRISLGRFGGGGGSNAVMSVDLRVVDTANGSIRMSKAVEETAKVGASFATEQAGGLAVGEEEADPLGEVQRVTAESIAALIAMDVFPIRVVNVSKGQAYVNYGTPTIDNGMYLRIVEEGEGFVDPDTGEVLGAEETYVGGIKIVDAKPKFSIGVILEGDISNGFTAYAMDEKRGSNLEKDYKKACKKRDDCLL